MKRTKLVFTFLTTILFAPAFALADGDRARDGVGDSRLSRLRRPVHEFREREDSLLKVLPEFAEQELVAFEEKLLVHRKAKKSGKH